MWMLGEGGGAGAATDGSMTHMDDRLQGQRQHRKKKMELKN